MAKRKIYNDKERAIAVTLLTSSGYPENKYKLQEVAEHIKVPSRTLRRWYKQEHNPPPDDVVIEVKKELADFLDDELNSIFQAMNIVREDASYKDLGTVAGILFDKKQLLEGKPTERLNVTLSDDERVKRINEILDTARGRRTGQPDSEYVQ